MSKKIIILFISLITLYSIGYSKLVVGTTGDYAPFSVYSNTSKTFSGKDITLIKDFAKAKNENIQFVKTTWKNAANDLKDGKFNVFVGGMTITPDRQKSFLFSTPLIAFYKAAMTQCKNLSNYKTLKDIDSPQSLVIENHGGTNQNFALETLKNAKILIISNNEQAINSLTNGISIGANLIYPNIMLTDTVEIAYQHSVNSKLCQIPIRIDKNNSYKAFMFNKNNKGKKLMQSFNQWLNSSPKLFAKYKKRIIVFMHR